MTHDDKIVLSVYKRVDKNYRKKISSAIERHSKISTDIPSILLYLRPTNPMFFMWPYGILCMFNAASMRASISVAAVHQVKLMAFLCRCADKEVQVAS